MTAECELLPAVVCGNFDHSAFEGTELVSLAPPTFPPGDGICGFSATRRIPTLGKAWIFVPSFIRREITGWQIALKVILWSSDVH